MHDAQMMQGTSGLASRFLRSRKFRSLLTALGVALGVALIVAMTVLGATLQASISDQLRQGFGSYDIMAGYHGKLMQPQEQARLRELPSVRYAVGVLWLLRGGPESQGVPMRYNYIGIGRFPAGEFAYPVKQGHYPGPGEFVAEERIVEAMGLKLGEQVTLPFRTGTQTVRLAGITTNAGAASSDSLSFDLSWLQQQMNLGQQVTLQLFGLSGRLDLSKPQTGAAMHQLYPDLDIQLRAELDEVRANMGGLKPMAVVFGLAALFAAIFLVASAFGIAVQERLRELALLRAIGAEPRQVVRLVLREAVLLGCSGAVAGVALGVLGAATVASLAARSLGVQAHAVALPWLPLLLETAVGVLLAVVAAWKPAQAAGKVAPLAAMRPDAATEARQERIGGWAGLLTLAVAVVLAIVATFMRGGGSARALVGALAGLGAAVGLILALPRLLPPVVAALARPLSLLSPALATLAGRAVLRHRRRSAQAIATLVLGLMLLGSMGTIMHEVVGTSQEYITSQFDGNAQVEIQPPGDLGRSLAPQLARIAGITAVAAEGQGTWGNLIDFDYQHADPEWLAEQNREREQNNVRNFDPKARIGLVPLDLPALTRFYNPGKVQGRLDGGGITLTSEQAQHRGIRLGDSLRFMPDRFQPQGEVQQQPLSCKVTAIVEHLPLRGPEFAAGPDCMPIAAISRVLFTYDPAQRAQVKAAVLTLLRQPEYMLASLRDLQDQLATFHQQAEQRFAMIGAVGGVILLIACLGLLTVVVTGLHQRRRETAMVRAVGSTPSQTRRQLLLEGLLLGLAGSLFGLLAGGVFTLGVLIALDSKITHGYPSVLYLGLLLGGPLLAVLASALPARQASRFAIAQMLQAE